MNTPQIERQQDSELHDLRSPSTAKVEPRKDNNVELEPESQINTAPLSKARSIALVMTLTGASFLNVVSTQAIVITLPVIRRDLDIPESRSQWIVSSYSLTFGCFLLLWGRIADVVGRKMIFILGTGLAVLANIANPFMRNDVAFNVFRGLAGIGGAASVPTAIGILGVTFRSGKRRNYAFATYSAGSAIGGAVGNILAGVISAYASWKWCFGVLAAFAAIILVSGIFTIPSQPSEGPSRKSMQALLKEVDWLGGLLITASLICLLFALTEGNIAGWSNAYIPILIVIAVLLVLTFTAWQWYQIARTSRPPLFNITLLRNLRFTSGICIMGMFFGGYNAFAVFATYLWQDFQGLSTIQTTLRFLPQGIMGTLVAFLMSILISRVPTCTLLVGANLAVALSCLLFAIPISPHTSYFATGLPAMILSVIGADVVWPCLTLFTSMSVPQADQAVGGAIINASGQIGRSIGLAISTAIQIGVMASSRDESVVDAGEIKAWDAASLAGLRAANWYNFGLLLVSAGVTAVTFRGLGVVGRIEREAESDGS
ncbi:MFS general substrate transporter [Aaosphaeria arxii CBS 175.79]|uniref:MFS general substrate transporter n=1 Tax=Aaosphaeria arxii CBS 175.79 TaxID=1450172 RepID=A0A6A5XN88_9PLEO|nr:MFS general substrate transporter [Aaosphaeria arxii CBS 175.79]KAF2014708.1 MFS general substrate transporter [Aaosphaeria arxii CBS 175.79]